jgi:hypothetical protein
MQLMVSLETAPKLPSLDPSEGSATTVVSEVTLYVYSTLFLTLYHIEHTGKGLYRSTSTRQFQGPVL